MDAEWGDENVQILVTKVKTSETSLGLGVLENDGTKLMRSC